MDKSITSDTPGTTRDIVSTETTMNGTPVLLLDTAGIHNPKDNIEAEGIRRSLDEIQSKPRCLAFFVKGQNPLILITEKNEYMCITKQICRLTNKKVGFYGVCYHRTRP